MVEKNGVASAKLLSGSGRRVASACNIGIFLVRSQNFEETLCEKLGLLVQITDENCINIKLLCTFVVMYIFSIFAELTAHVHINLLKLNVFTLNSL